MLNADVADFNVLDDDFDFAVVYADIADIADIDMMLMFSFCSVLGKELGMLPTNYSSFRYSMIVNNWHFLEFKKSYQILLNTYETLAHPQIVQNILITRPRFFV